MKIIKKKKFKPEIKPMIKNLQDELLNLKKKQAKDVKLCANSSWELEAKKC